MRGAPMGVLASGLGLAMLLGIAHLLRPPRSAVPAARAGLRDEARGASGDWAEARLAQERGSGRSEGDVVEASEPGLGRSDEVLAEPSESADPVPDESAREALWTNLDELGSRRGSAGEAEYRAEALRATAEFLGFDPATAHAFGQAQAEAQLDLDRVQQAMGGMFVGVPDELSDDELVRTQREAEERFRADREAALGRLESFLDGSPRHRWFRERLAEWMGYLAGGPDER